ncbi:hypothetical protein SUGI_0342050 [Cryptomeria japonica]|uniref:protein ABC transporter 1, mitochondrial n=1 Tax=Cryptomeria japonica TaxID=3369 RepID=UPI002408CB8B|nr:protein ABC transporter 1, mitochondrial [Cryptomeria japonica]GLJ19056.1 hypothetical protein SUGI_0342050 [Cryptomeria japonica]
MARTRELKKIIDGVSLVAKEAVQSSVAIKSLQNGHIGSFIALSLNNLVNTATDLAGLTRGKIHEYEKPGKKKKNSVVYFTAASENAAANEVINDSGHMVDFEREISPATENFGNPKEIRANSLGQETVVADYVVDTKAKLTHSGVNLVDSGAVDSKPTLADSGANLVDSVAGNAEGLKDSKREGDVTNVGDVRDYVPNTVIRKSYVASAGDRKATVSVPVKKRKLRERRVPETPFGRALGFAGLGAGLAWGTIQESAKRLVFGEGDLQGGQSAISPFLSEQNAERLALALCRMRGAALKLGQMLSIQDESLIPAPILSALEIVRQGADVMPREQLNNVLTAELGTNWQSKLRSFDYEPMAAASIGQVHKAVTKDGIDVAVKIQYPGVANSIDSDIENVRRLLDYTNLIPKGLFLDQAMKVAKSELARECDYELEAANQKRFRELMSGIDGFYVPFVIDEISSKRVLSTELVQGMSIEKVAQLNKETRNHVGRKLLELTLKELFVFRFMQTDPNWSNFLYDESTNTINLIDFGAAQDYSKDFVDNYLRMVLACANRDRETVLKMSCRLGFLTGMESEILLDAHTQAAFVVGLPFSRPGDFDFKSTNMATNVSQLGATMLKHRLTPPPDEVYSLHRKLSGAFLACIKLGAVVPCREMLLDVYNNYKFSDVEEDEQDTTCLASAQ